MIKFRVFDIKRKTMAYRVKFQRIRTDIWLYIKHKCGVKEGELIPKRILWIKGILFPIEYIKYIKNKK